MEKGAADGRPRGQAGLGRRRILSWLVLAMLTILALWSVLRDLLAILFIGALLVALLAVIAWLGYQTMRRIRELAAAARDEDGDWA